MSGLIGKKLGKYEILERLGQGGMAEVYKAYQPEVERFVAVKVMHCHLTHSEELVARFLREARAIGRLDHPNIVHILDAGIEQVRYGADQEQEYYYLVMNYIEGETLGHYLQTHKRLTIQTALHIGYQLADALACAHQQGMVHRDIKPTNILLRNRSPQELVLTDFGLARLCDDRVTGLTVSGAMVGTPTYMSPEAVRGEPCTAQSDIYSIGAVLYELLTGKPPYVANTPYSMMMKLANEPLPPPRTLNPDLPPAVETMLLKALNKVPSARYESAAALQTAITDCQQALAMGHAQTPLAPTGDSTPLLLKTLPAAPTTAAKPVAMAENRLGQLGLAVTGVALVAAIAIDLLMKL